MQFRLSIYRTYCGLYERCPFGESPVFDQSYIPWVRLKDIDGWPGIAAPSTQVPRCSAIVAAALYDQWPACA
jgi:hypothetical protein